METTVLEKQFKNDKKEKKMSYTYKIKYYPGIKKNEILPLATARMNLEDIMLTEISQSEEDKYHRFHLHAESKEQNT